MSDNIVFMPCGFYDEMQLEKVGYKCVGSTLGFSWLSVNLMSKTYERIVTMEPGSVIMSALSIVVLSVLEERDEMSRPWMKHGRDYLFASCWIPDVLYVKSQLKGIREGINE